MTQDEEGAAGAPTPDDADNNTSPPDPTTEPNSTDLSAEATTRQPDADTRPRQLALPGMDADEEDDLAWPGLEGLARLAASGGEFTADELRFIAGVPPRRNRVGAAFLAAQARGEIVPVGVTRSCSRSRHAGKLTVWRGAA